MFQLTKKHLLLALLHFNLIVGFNYAQPHLAQQKEQQKGTKLSQSDLLMKKLRDPKDKDILVASHRGDWRNAPENSLQAIQYCIDMGVDIVEIDVQESKDGVLVLIHDKSVDRTTKHKGLVKDFTLEELKKMNLLNGIGSKTPNTIPTLEEALILSKGKILLNLDKSYDYFEKCIDLAQKTGTLNQIIMKGNATREEVEQKMGKGFEKICFMPIIKLNGQSALDYINDYMKHQKPVAFEINVPSDTIKVTELYKDLRQQGTSVWMNSLWAMLNGGRDDEKAVLDNTVYDWYIQNQVKIIQTDRPQVLLNYLRSKGKHK